MAHIEINGKACSFERNDTLIDVARRSGIRIPTLCYHAKLSPIGSCRVCMVEVAGAGKPMAACMTEAVDGMVVQTDSERVRELRRTAIRLLLAGHDTACHVCEASGQCELQNLAYEYDVAEHNLISIRRGIAVGEYATPLIHYNPDRCVMCLRCIRACKEIKGIEALSIGLRGSFAHVKGDKEKCISCGECLHLCPVGALTQTLFNPPLRISQMESVRTTCTYCGVGCQMDLRVLDNKIWAVTTDDGAPPNYGSLCVKGRFGFDFVDHPDRLTTPLIRKKGILEPVEWDEAISFTADKLRAIKEKHGPDAVMGLSSARCTNEENYLFQKFIRAAIGTNNVDHCARL